MLFTPKIPHSIKLPRPGVPHFSRHSCASSFSEHQVLGPMLLQLPKFLHKISKSRSKSRSRRCPITHSDTTVSRCSAEDDGEAEAEQVDTRALFGDSDEEKEEEEEEVAEAEAGREATPVCEDGNYKMGETETARDRCESEVQKQGWTHTPYAGHWFSTLETL